MFFLSARRCEFFYSQQLSRIRQSCLPLPTENSGVYVESTASGVEGNSTQPTIEASEDENEAICLAGHSSEFRAFMNVIT